ncbi:DegT/DnrJ/EryC1/StrS aminotransferase family protein [Halalkalibacter sp. APA_J-10(15)]|uniref:DegT/DnrJ/EryC1/StrS family aminotransferase n=1 Tax=Halalkalibacter sp. APA_J-10(15) TaxID=2933805 RepID=UPI001FF62B96|nr:DegT/DnrJ/EryC1/StrS family aminotransferase [Halalkalibacter sp. APA_J-10(15)]MCK0472939.1 DegT/DnrJ/EryC1/StrS family aminotransferase [Halalkalibacter sp. APA_J-10(15)]
MAERLIENKPIPVTEPSFPPLEEYVEYLKEIWESKQLTNNGSMVQRLEAELRKYLGVKHCYFVTNGTMALQLSMKALNLTGEIITTPFSFVATTSAIVWEQCTPVFVDIDPKTLNINPDLIEEMITEKTEAILITHVFGNPCDVDRIEEISNRHKLKVIYDGAHAFGVEYKGQSLLSFGDISTVSFHATKLFGTVEGGAVITNNDEIAHKIEYMRNFGMSNGELWGLGINAKNSELHAAFGLCMLPKVNELISSRKVVSQTYDKLFFTSSLGITKPSLVMKTRYNYAYYPILLSNEKILLKVMNNLQTEGFFPKRYFYPSLNTLSYVTYRSKAISEEISKKTLCLPLYSNLTIENAEEIVNNIIESI